MIDDCEKAFL